MIERDVRAHDAVKRGSKLQHQLARVGLIEVFSGFKKKF